MEARKSTMELIIEERLGPGETVAACLKAARRWDAEKRKGAERVKGAVKPKEGE